MSDTATADANTQVSHTDDAGRVLTGVGISAERLAETMERHTPAPPPDAKGPSSAPDGGRAPEAVPGTTEPPLSRGRQRFSDLTKERDEAKAAAEAAKSEREAIARERDELKARLSAPPAAAAQPAAEPAKPAAPVATRPEPRYEELGTKYQSLEELNRDHIKWVLEQERYATEGSIEERVRAAIDSEREKARFAHTLNQARERGRKVYPDFDTLLDTSPAGDVPLGKTEDEAKARVRFIAQHPQSEHIQHAILKSVDLAQQLQQADHYTFGAIVASLVPAPSKPQPAWTPPPAPHSTVGASSPTTPVASADLSKKGFDFDNSGYRERRAAERGVKPRR